MKNRGITLVALVITIIILIILAGITISSISGNNGILNKVEKAKEKDNEASAREKLVLALLEANIEKQQNKEFNKEEFLTEMLENKNMVVTGDFVIVDNHTYIIDRDKLIIVDKEGELIIPIPIEITEYLGANENGKYEVKGILKIENNTEIKSVTLRRQDGTTEEISLQEAVEGKEITMELDIEYELLISYNDGKTEKRKIVEPSVENIRSVEELIAFRDKVKSGLTYEGKTINVLKDLDLSEVCGEQKGNWEPIAPYISDTKSSFKATFDGKNHKISNLYINTTKNYQGLFASNGGTIQNIILENVSITNSKTSTAGLVAYNVGDVKNIKVNNGIIQGYQNVAGIIALNEAGNVENCENRAEIKYGNYGSDTGWRFGGIVGGGNGIIKRCINYGSITGTYMVGGIVGINDSGAVNKVEECVNHGDVKTNATSVNARSGGIAGVMAYYKQGEIINCYNTGSISSVDISGGIVGYEGTSKLIVTNSYNVGTISGRYKGGISGENQGTREGTNNYYLDTCGATYGESSGTTKITKEQFLTLGTTLGEAYIDDEEIKDEQGNGTGTYKYNNGYPILRWQIGL